MINANLAKKFVERIAKYTDYNINIMNDQGIIIASRNPERIGSFHETAYNMIRFNLEISSVSNGDALLGVQYATANSPLRSSASPGTPKRCGRSP